MNNRILLLLGLLTGLVGCTDKTEQAAEVGSEAFVKHMHRHAVRVDQLNAALDAGDLDGAQTPAYWVSAHPQLAGAPDSWQPYLESMRDAAAEIAGAADLEAARLAADRIADSCAACHTASGVDVPDL